VRPFGSLVRSCAAMDRQDPAAAMAVWAMGEMLRIGAPLPRGASRKSGQSARVLRTLVRAGAGQRRRGEDGVFTGYYEPELFASRTRHGAFQTPVYGTPDDLVSVDLGAFRAKLRGERIAGKVEQGRLVPYATRAQIDAAGLPRAHILFYADNPIAVFFLHIQGSGRVRFDDGGRARVSYAAQNGQIYTPIGQTLKLRGALEPGKISMQSIAAWLRANPSVAREVMQTNASYVFFKEEPIGDPVLGATGGEGAALYSGREPGRRPKAACAGRGRSSSPPHCRTLNRCRVFSLRRIPAGPSAVPCEAIFSSASAERRRGWRAR